MPFAWHQRYKRKMFRRPCANVTLIITSRREGTSCLVIDLSVFQVTLYISLSVAWWCFFFRRSHDCNANEEFVFTKLFPQSSRLWQENREENGQGEVYYGRCIIATRIYFRRKLPTTPFFREDNLSGTLLAHLILFCEPLSVKIIASLSNDICARDNFMIKSNINFPHIRKCGVSVNDGYSARARIETNIYMFEKYKIIISHTFLQRKAKQYVPAPTLKNFFTYNQRIFHCHSQRTYLV